MRAYKSFNKYKSDQPFWQWIAAIANNYCIDLLRKRSRTQALFGDEQEEIDQVPAEDAPVLEHLLSMENVALVNDAVAELPEKYRVPLVLAYFNQSAYDEIASQLGRPVGSIGPTRARCLQRLRDILGSTDGA